MLDTYTDTMIKTDAGRNNRRDDKDAVTKTDAERLLYKIFYLSLYL